MSPPVVLRRVARALAVALSLLLAGEAQAASALTVRVDDDRAQCPGARFRAITAALAAVPAGSTVQVCPGRYVGAVHMDKPDVRLAGLTASRSNVVVVPAPGDTAVVDMTAAGTTLANLSIRDGGVSRGACPQEFVGVDNGTEPSARASVIAGVTVRESAGCGIPGALGIRIGNDSERGAAPGRVVVRDSTILLARGGIIVLEGSATIRRNVIRAPHLGGISEFAQNGIFGGDRIQQNTVSGFSVGIWIPRGAPAAVVGGPGLGNHVFQNQSGVVVEGSGGTVVDNAIHHNIWFGLELGSVGTVVSGNVIDANGTGGLLVGTEASGNLIVGNRATNNGLSPDPIFVPVGDCRDLSTGKGTAGTANTWIDNTGATSIPRTICPRPPGA